MGIVPPSPQLNVMENIMSFENSFVILYLLALTVILLNRVDILPYEEMFF